MKQEFAVSKDLAIFIDKCVKFATENYPPIELDVLYTLIPAPELAEFSKQLQSFAYNEEWVENHKEAYTVEHFEKAQQDIRNWLEQMGVKWERLS